MSRKVFTAGEVLAASDVNSFLMDQTVMSFANTAARGSAIPTPTLGMYTHLEDTPARTQFWNGSAWVSPFGATLITSAAVSAATSLTVSNVFSSTYENYIITWVGTGNGGSLPINFDLASGGSRVNTAQWNGIRAVAAASPTPADSFVFGTTEQPALVAGNTNSGGTIQVFNPGIATATIIIGDGFSRSTGDLTKNNLHGVHQTAAAYDGFHVSSSNQLTGTFRVYGLRN
jgi:hypothetical protein